MAAVVVSGRIECVSDAKRLWRAVADTDRLNRVTGAHALDAKLTDGHFDIHERAGPINLDGEEKPFEFIEGERFRGVRTMSGGPFVSLVSEVTLAPKDGGGCVVTMQLTLTPRSLLYSPLAKLAARRALGTRLAAMKECDASLARGDDAFASFAAAGKGVTAPPTAALDRAALELARTLPKDLAALVKRVVELVRTGADVDLAQIRPFDLADSWGVDRRDLISVCLAGVVAGLFELRWALVCPSCQQASDRVPELEQIESQGHCDLCDLSFGMDFDRSVECTFRPTEAVRPIEDRPFCVGSPARFPHVLVQALLPGGATVPVRAPPAPGRYRLFLRGGSVSSIEVDGGAPAEVVVTAGEALAPQQLAVAPSGVIRVASAAGAGDRHVKLERLEFAGHAATAAYVSTLPAFRRLFSGQVLRPGLLLKVARATFLFTDLAGSTALYTKAGDAAAFRVIHDHFEVLRKAIEARKGVIVKTIGDSVMAVFLDEPDAVRAGVAMLEEFAAFRAVTPDAATLALRVGLHGGACYAVTANKLLDYFGQTVNIAARLQGQAKEDELVVAEEIAGTATAGGWLGPAQVAGRFTCTLKGLDTTTDAARIRLPHDARRADRTG